MLLDQAHALQAIFVNLPRRANKQKYLRQWEAYIRAALKAQSQCRATLETLASRIRRPCSRVRPTSLSTPLSDLCDRIRELDAVIAFESVGKLMQ